MNIFDLVVGILLLVAGRKLFWLCVGIIGFLIGFNYVFVPHLSHGIPQGLFYAIMIGIFGAVLAMSFQWFMIVFVIGFLGGGHLLLTLLPISLQIPPSYLFLIGGVIGMVFVILVFDWALIIISSLLGISLLAKFFPGQTLLSYVLFFSTLIAGVLIQGFSKNLFDQAKK